MAASGVASDMLAEKGIQVADGYVRLLNHASGPRDRASGAGVGPILAVNDLWSPEPGCKI